MDEVCCINGLNDFLYTVLISQSGFLQVVDGVLTQDSDVFLYGARVVYKDLSTTERVIHFHHHCHKSTKSLQLHVCICGLILCCRAEQMLYVDVGFMTPAVSPVSHTLYVQDSKVDCYKMDTIEKDLGM